MTHNPPLEPISMMVVYRWEILSNLRYLRLFGTNRRSAARRSIEAAVRSQCRVRMTPSIAGRSIPKISASITESFYLNACSTRLAKSSRLAISFQVK